MLESIGFLTLIFGSLYFFLRHLSTTESSNAHKDQLISKSEKCKSLIRENNELIREGKAHLTPYDLKQKLYKILDDPTEQTEIQRKLNEEEEKESYLEQLNRKKRKVGYKYEIDIFEIFDTKREITKSELINSIKFRFNFDNEKAEEILNVWLTNNLISECNWNPFKWKIGVVLTSSFYNIDSDDLTWDKWVKQNCIKLELESKEYIKYMDENDLFS